MMSPHLNVKYYLTILILNLVITILKLLYFKLKMSSSSVAAVITSEQSDSQLTKKKGESALDAAARIAG